MEDGRSIYVNTRMIYVLIRERLASTTSFSIVDTASFTLPLIYIVSTIYPVAFDEVQLTLILLASNMNALAAIGGAAGAIKRQYISDNYHHKM